MEKEISTLKEVYLNLWLRGLLFSSVGILNVLSIMGEFYNKLSGTDVSYWKISLSLFVVFICLKSSVQLQNKRRILFAKIKNNV